MYEDDPQDTSSTCSASAVFGEHPLGRPIIGRAPVIRDTPVDEIAAFHARRYVPGSVVDRGGRLGRPRRDRRARRAHARRAARAASRAPPPEPAPDAPARDAALPAQGHRAGPRLPRRARAAARATTAASPLRVLDAIFGGLSSSRLFQAVREERGLAYSVYSFAGQFTDTGQIGLYVGTRPDNLAEAMQVVARRARPPARASRRHRGGARRARARTSRRAIVLGAGVRRRRA